MSQRTTLFFAIVALIGSVLAACGSKCPKAMAAKSGKVLARKDAERINSFVERRKGAIKIAKSGSEFDVEKAKFTVTACELAIKLQLRIINLSKEETEAYDANADKINETRCLFDKVLEKKGKSMLFVGKGGFINRTDASKIQDEYAHYQQLLGELGDPRNSQVKEVFENGIPVLKPKKKKKKKSEIDESDDGAEVEEVAGDEADSDEAAGEEGEKEEEEEEEEEEEGAMDSF